MLLHRPLHRAADGAGLARALGIADLVEPRDRRLGRGRRHRSVRGAGLDNLGGAFGRGTAKDQQVEQ